MEKDKHQSPKPSKHLTKTEIIQMMFNLNPKQDTADVCLVAEWAYHDWKP